MKRSVFDVDDLNRITKFVHALNALTKEQGIVIGGDIDLWLGDDSTPFNVEHTMDGYVLAMAL